MKGILTALVFTAWCALPYNSNGAENQESAPLYRFAVVSGATKAISYKNVRRATKIDFKGTVLSPNARGGATIKRNGGVLNIEAYFENLELPQRYGEEYLTYVLWAVSPEGRAINLGEILLDDGEGELQATTQLQSFGLIVSAEPYFAVTQLSDVVVMENAPRKHTAGNTYTIRARPEFLSRGQYTLNATGESSAADVDDKTPFYLLQARNALKIARGANAHTFAPEPFKRADELLKRAEEMQKGKRRDRKQVPMTAREAIQTSEDARLIAAKRQEGGAKPFVEKNEKERDEPPAKAAKQPEPDEIPNPKQSEKMERQEADNERAAIRSQLQKKLSMAVDTSESPRGLVMNLSDSFFESAKFELQPQGKNKLAEAAGILLTHPGLRYEVEGHTDNIGKDDFNQQLSEKRAAAVRDFLIQQGLPAEAISARGFGKQKPLVPNTNSAARRKNRRVEVTISGDLIGGRI